jgi:hypothetical protein
MLSVDSQHTAGQLNNATFSIMILSKMLLNAYLQCTNVTQHNEDINHGMD